MSESTPSRSERVGLDRTAHESMLPAVPSAPPRIAFISAGQLFVHDAAGTVREIGSTFADEVVAREEQAQRRHGWKTDGADDPADPFNRQARWGRQTSSAEVHRPRFTAVTRGATPDEIAYALAAQGVGGLFTQTLSEREERRLMHKNTFFASHLDRHAVTGALLYSRTQKDGSANLCMRERDAPNETELTEGDSVDDAPSWCADVEHRVVYHSCGIGRDARGLAFGFSPTQIERLDLKTGEVVTLAYSDGHDLLCPRVDSSGRLTYIRRPYEDPRKVSRTHALKSALLFPWHVLTAVVGFLNAFSMMFGGKPLARSREGGAGLDPAGDLAHHRIWGRAVDSRKLLKASKGHEIESLVPASWELVRQEIHGETAVIAKGVAAYDQDAQGRLVLSNGVELRLLEAAESQMVHRQIPIEAVRILG